MKIDFEGTVYDYEDEDLTVAQGMAIEKHIGGTLLDWQNGLVNPRTDCYQALGWLIFRGGGPGVKIADVEFPVLKLVKAYHAALAAQLGDLAGEAEAAVADAEAAVAEDPTRPPAPPRGRRS